MRTCLHRCISLVIFLAAASFVAGPSRAEASTIVDFESLAPNTFVNGTYAGIGWGTNNWVVSTYGYLPFPTPVGAGPQAVYFDPSVGATNSFVFATPQIFLGASFSGPGSFFDPRNGPVQGTQVAFNLYDSANNLVHTSGSVTTDSVMTFGPNGMQWVSGSAQFLASGYALPVSRVQVVVLNIGQLPNASSFVMDGVTYDTPTTTPAPVPEPTSIVLLAGGLVVLFGSRRRRP